MNIEYEKIDEIANRLRQFEEDGIPRYVRIEYSNPTDQNGQPFKIAEKLTGEQEFRRRINNVLNNLNPEKIIVSEFSQKSRNGKPVNTIVINVENEKREKGFIPIAMQQPKSTGENQVGNNETQKQIYQAINNLSQSLAGVDTIKQEAYSEFILKNELEKKTEKIEKLEEEKKKLQNDVDELTGDNTKLFKYNEELAGENKKLQKYVPDNITVAGVSITKVLGSILGNATETVIKNVVAKRPEKVRSLLGEAGLEALSGIFEDPGERGFLEGGNTLGGQNQELQKVQELSPEEEEKLKIVGIIHDINKGATSGQLSRIQLLYYHILDDDETINDNKLLGLAKFVQKKYQEKQTSGSTGNLQEQENEPAGGETEETN
jgi:hypothetical protein